MPISNSARLAGAAAFALLTGIAASAAAQNAETAPAADDAEVTTGEGSAPPVVQERRRIRGGATSEENAKAPVRHDRN